MSGYKNSKYSKNSKNNFDFHSCPIFIKPWRDKSMVEKLVWYYEAYTSNLCLNVLSGLERVIFNLILGLVVVAISYFWGGGFFMTSRKAERNFIFFD